MDYEGHPCTSCGKKRAYTSKQGVAKSKGNNCKSCANSMSNGGTGLSYDKDGNRLCARCKKTEQGQTTLYASPVPLLIYLRGFRRDTGTRGTVLIRNGLMLGLKDLVRYATKKYL